GALHTQRVQQLFTVLGRGFLLGVGVFALLVQRGGLSQRQPHVPGADDRAAGQPQHFRDGAVQRAGDRRRQQPHARKSDGAGDVQPAGGGIPAADNPRGGGHAARADRDRGSDQRQRGRIGPKLVGEEPRQQQHRQR